MFLSIKRKSFNKFFFIGYFRRIFFSYNFMLFFNILEKTSSHIINVKLLKFKKNLNSVILNSNILKSIFKKNDVNILPGNYLVLYTNKFMDILSYLLDSAKVSNNILPFALLIKRSFIFLDAKTLKCFLIAAKEINNSISFVFMFANYKLTFRSISVNILSMFRSMIFDSKFVV